jgi:hypothetical protein
MRIERTSEFRRIKKIALDAGWDVYQTAKGHWRFVPPEGIPVVMSGSPKDGERVFRHYKPRLRAAGLKV